MVTPRPLAGRRILVARARPGPSAVAADLRTLGAEVLEAPTIEVTALTTRCPPDPVLTQLQLFQGIIFGCAVGIHMTAPYMGPISIAIVAVGESAAAALGQHGIQSTVLLKGACGEACARHAAFFQGGRFLLVGSEAGRPNLTTEIERYGAIVKTVAVYRHINRMPQALPRSIDLIVLPSSSAARSVLSGAIGAGLHGTPMVAIGPRTEAAARQCGARHVTCVEEDRPSALVRFALSLMKQI